MPRLFIAIDLPTPIKTSLHQLARTIPHSRIVKTHQLHLTLKFLGDVTKEDTNTIQNYLRKIQHNQFNMQIQSVGKFPSKGKARVIWAGVNASSQLIQLQSKVDQIITPENPVEKYIPHITLARVRKQAVTEDIHHFLQINTTFSLPSFFNSQFTLYSSNLTPKGAIHTPIENYPLITNGSS